MQAKTFNFQKETFRVENVGLIALSKATIEPRITYRAENGEVIKAFLPVSVFWLPSARSATMRMPESW